MSWFRIAEDWSAVRRIQKDLWSALQEIKHKPGVGIELPKNDPRVAVAAQRLVDKNPNVMFARYTEKITLMWKPNWDRAVGKEMQGWLADEGYIAQQGDAPEQSLDLNIKDAETPEEVEVKVD